ncbi:MAG: YciI family protein [Nocardioidaceae bacterium]
MKYVLMFTSRPDLADAIDPELAKQVYAATYQWFQEHGAAGRIADSGAELHPVTTATTIKHGDDGPLVVDGPFNEAKEVIGGFTVIDVPDMDAAVAMTKSWPMLAFPGVAVEIRPMVEDYSQFEE